MVQRYNFLNIICHTFISELDPASVLKWEEKTYSTEPN
jgi:hypothetical protein